MTDRPALSRATRPRDRAGTAPAAHREIFARFVDRLAARLARAPQLRRA